MGVSNRLLSLTHELSGILLPGAQAFFDDEELCCSSPPGGFGRRDGDREGRGVRLSDGTGLLRQEVRLSLWRWPEWDARDRGSSGRWAGGRGRQDRDEGTRRGDEEQRGHLLQGSPALQGEDALEEVGDAGVAEGEGDGGACAQDDGGVQAKDVPPVHGRPLSRKKCQPNIPSVIVFQRDPK